MGTCLTGYLEICLDHLLEPWVHIATFEFFKDYELMRALRNAKGRHQGCPHDTGVWIHNHGRLTDDSSYCDSVYWFSGEDFATVTLDLDEMTAQHVALCSLAPLLSSLPRVKGVRITFTEA